MHIGVGGHGCCPQGHTAGTPGLWRPQGGSGRGRQVTLPARSPCTSNHRAPLAGAGAASTGAAKGMRDGATEPAVPPGTCWPGMAGHGTATPPAATSPVTACQGTPRKNHPSAAGCQPHGARPHPALPCAQSGCFHGSHRVPTEISCSRTGPGTQPFPGSPWLPLPHGWHRPRAGITLPPFQGPRALPAPHARCRGAGAGRGKREGDPKPAPNPRQSLPIPHARPGRECAEAAPGGGPSLPLTFAACRGAAR